MIEDGESVLYQSQGIALFGLRKGKRCKAFVSKKDHDKVVGVNEYIADIIAGIILLI